MKERGSKTFSEWGVKKMVLEGTFLSGGLEQQARLLQQQASPEQASQHSFGIREEARPGEGRGEERRAEASGVRLLREFIRPGRLFGSFTCENPPFPNKTSRLKSVVATCTVLRLQTSNWFLMLTSPSLIGKKKNPSKPRGGPIIGPN